MDKTSDHPFGSQAGASSRRIEGLVSSPTTGTMDRAAAVAGEKLEATANLIRKKTSHEGVMSNAATTVASGLEDLGAYLQEQGLSGAIDEVEILIRRYPVQSLLLGLGLGYLLAKMRAR